MAQKSPEYTKKYARTVEKKIDDVTLEYAKEPIIAAAYSYHPAHQLEYGVKFYEENKILTFSQGNHFSKLMIHHEVVFNKGNNTFTDYKDGPCNLNKGKILCVAPSPLNNKLINFYDRGKVINKEYQTTYLLYVNRSFSGGHINKIALGTDRNTIVIVCNEYCGPKVRYTNGVVYDICPPKVLGKEEIRGGYGSDSDSDNSDEYEDEDDYDYDNSESESGESHYYDDEEEDELTPEEQARNVEMLRLENERIIKEKAEQEIKRKEEAEQEIKRKEEAKIKMIEDKENKESRIFELGIEPDKTNSHTGPINALAWNSVGTRLVSVSSDTTLRMWGFVTLASTIHRDYVKDWWNSLTKDKVNAYKKQNKIELLTGDEVYAFVLNDLTAQKKKSSGDEFRAQMTWEIEQKKEDKKNIKSGWDSEQWHHYWVSEKSIAGKQKYHTKPVLSVSWSPDDKYIVSGAEDGVIILWNPEDGTHIKTLKGHTGPVRSFAWSYNSDILYSCSEDGTVKIWKKAAKDIIHERPDFHFHSSLGKEKESSAPLKFLSLAVNEQYIVAGTEDGFIYVWDVKTYKKLTVLKKHTGAITGLFWKDPRDPTTIVNPPPNVDKQYSKQLIRELIKDPETLISTSLDKKIKLINIGSNVRRIRRSHAHSLTKKFYKETVPMARDRPDVGTVRGGPEYQKHVKHIFEDRAMEVLKPITEEIHEKSVRLDTIKNKLNLEKPEKQEEPVGARLEKLTAKQIQDYYNKDAAKAIPEFREKQQNEAIQKIKEKGVKLNEEVKEPEKELTSKEKDKLEKEKLLLEGEIKTLRKVFTEELDSIKETRKEELDRAQKELEEKEKEFGKRGLSRAYFVKTDGFKAKKEGGSYKKGRKVKRTRKTKKRHNQ